MVNRITKHIDIWSAAQTPKTNGAGRGNGTARHSLHGIKKLRELILELAVRGKLVHQDPNDLPASDLLEKIAREKERLVKEGKIKKQQPLPEISEDEKPFELPSGWKWARLGSISQINPRNEAEDQLAASFIPMPLISTSYTGEHGQEIKMWGEIKKGYTHFADGDIGVAKITPCFENSKAVIFSGLENGIGAGTTELHIARPFAFTLVPRYVLLFLKSPMFLKTGETKMTGTAGQKRLPKEFFSGFPLPLPPRAEQHRIVAQVDELMALCDQLEQQQIESSDTHQILVETLLASLTNAADQKECASAWQRIVNHFDTLFTTEQSIDQLKQTILQLAVMGKLVPQDPNDLSASDLLKKIAKEKARLIKEGKIKKDKPLPGISEDEKPFELPTGWVWVRLGDIASTRLGKMLDKSKNRGNPMPYLRNTNVQWHSFALDDVKEMRFEDSELDEYRVQPGDLLICEGGEPGRCAIWEDPSKEIYFQKAIHRVRPFSGVAVEFLQVSLTKDAKNGDLGEYFTGATIKHFPGDKLNRYLFPLPPKSEQHRIVAKVDELMAICDGLKVRLNEAQTTQVQLADAIVEQAVA